VRGSSDGGVGKGQCFGPVCVCIVCDSYDGRRALAWGTYGLALRPLLVHARRACAHSVRRGAYAPGRAGRPGSRPGAHRLWPGTWAGVQTRRDRARSTAASRSSRRRSRSCSRCYIWTRCHTCKVMHAPLRSQCGQMAHLAYCHWHVMIDATAWTNHGPACSRYVFSVVDESASSQGMHAGCLAGRGQPLKPWPALSRHPGTRTPHSCVATY
jgi:hypothetical protein